MRTKGTPRAFTVVYPTTYRRPLSRKQTGLFAVTAGEGIELIAQEFRDEGDDYGALLYKLSVTDLPKQPLNGLQKVRRHWGQAEVPSEQKITNPPQKK